MSWDCGALSKIEKREFTQQDMDIIIHGDPQVKEYFDVYVLQEFEFYIVGIWIRCFGIVYVLQHKVPQPFLSIQKKFKSLH